MIIRQFGNLPLWQFEKLAKVPNVKHFVSGRHGGISEGDLGSLNIGFRSIEKRENVLENRKRIAEVFDVDISKLIFPFQMHTDNVRLVDQNTSPDDLLDTDGIITNTKNIFICVMSADCVPILLYDQKNHAAAAIHAGWRGTVSKILTKAVLKMQENFSTQPSALIAGIGPSICNEVYEVGEEVIDATYAAYGKNNNLIRLSDKKGKGYLNLWEANALQLKELGVSEHNIEIAGICTYTNNNQFFSARRSERSGRFGAGIMLL